MQYIISEVLDYYFVKAMQKQIVKIDSILYIIITYT